MEPIYVVAYQDDYEMDILGAYRNREDAIKAMCEDVRNETFLSVRNPEAIRDTQFTPGMELEYSESRTTVYARIEDDELSAELSTYGFTASWQIIKVNGIK